jgi:hypothetical protein
VQGQEPDEEMQPILSYGQNSQLVYWWVLVHSGHQIHDSLVTMGKPTPTFLPFKNLKVFGLILNIINKQTIFRLNHSLLAVPGFKIASIRGLNHSRRLRY